MTPARRRRPRSSNALAIVVVAVSVVVVVVLACASASSARTESQTCARCRAVARGIERALVDVDANDDDDDVGDGVTRDARRAFDGRRGRVMTHGRSERAIARGLSDACASDAFARIEMTTDDDDGFDDGFDENGLREYCREIVNDERMFDAIENEVFARGTKGVGRALCEDAMRACETRDEL